MKYWNPVALIRLPFSAAVISRKGELADLGKVETALQAFAQRDSQRRADDEYDQHLDDDHSGGDSNDRGQVQHHEFKVE